MLMANNELTLINVGISFAFILFNIGVSSVLRLGIGLSVFIAALRCGGQLALVATILHEVFENKNPWLVALICCAFSLSLVCVLDTQLVAF
jgi:ABC-type iron transport system FetAB permease component